MYAGQLSQRQFQGWVANRLAYQRVVPRKDAAILSNCPDPAVRREWIQRIIDHDGTEPGTGGIELWIRLGVALGVPREEMEDERHVLPAARLICESYVHLLQDASRGWRRCASSLTELFAPKIHQQRIEAFPKHYPWIPPEALDYFKSRLVQAPRDVSHGLSHRTDALHHGGDPARRVRGAGVQAGDAVGDDRHDPHAYARSRRGTEPGRRCPPSGSSPAWTSTPCAAGRCCSTPRAPCCSTTRARRSWSWWTAAAACARSPRILGERYQTDVTADVTEYLSHLAERELIRDR